MESLSGDREERIRRIFREVWLPLLEDYHRSGISEAEFKRHEETIIGTLTNLCQPEIVGALLENFVGCVLCDVQFVVEGGKVVSISYPEIVASDGVRRSVDTITKVGGNRSLREHVKICAAEVFADCQAEVREEWRKLPPTEVLPYLVGRSRSACAVLLGELTDKQRSELRGLLHNQLAGNRAAVPLRMDIEPKAQRRWVFWYLWRREMTQPETVSALGGVPRVVVVLGEKTLRINKRTGKPYDPLGVIHAKISQRLSREKNLHGHPIQNPGSTSPIARSQGVSRSTIDDYLEADVPIQLTPDGKGAFHVQFSMDSLLAALDVYKNKRRGRKPKQS
jgi:hypothetical protein